ncbi:MAG: hypothetical protein GOMPHAMPRED_000688 [Gomphillus americanus]|uniref:Urease accessory protein UreF n=1 Tax=Gomphillus americanus TaxID=1940652 RepID=A0A8H3IC57_9LECA|nr:MAG: hypothetical protein GOMPHAMPRED_000688 [Gomphillus americanus]
MASVTNSEHPVTTLGPSFPPALLLLSDSALPLGSFAFSSGLESYLAHHAAPSLPRTGANRLTDNGLLDSKSRSHISTFLSLSLYSVSSSVLPYLIAAYMEPSRLQTLDNDLDASITCTVARRASIAQGRALLAVWDKAFKSADSTPALSHQEAVSREQATQDAAFQGRVALDELSTGLKVAFPEESFTTLPPPPNGHLAPLFALVCLSQSLSLADTAWIFLFNHARAVLSAAVRAGAMGPYQSQAVLASSWLRDILAECSQRGMKTGVHNASQCVPAMDIWSGRHELLYTRIFNS